MQILFVFAVLVSFVYAKLSATGCEMFNCKLSTQKFNTNTCVYWNQKADSYYVQPCTGSASFCPPNHDSNSTCQVPQNSNHQAWPGEKCNSTTTCNSYATKGCVLGVCQGLANGDVCQDSNSCNPGFYCMQGICSPLIKTGQIACTQDFECVNGAGCDFRGSPANSKCIAYLSLPPHTEVGQCQADQNRLCSSGMCAQKNGKFYCTESLKSYAFLPMVCDENSECTSTTDTFFGNNFDLSSSCDCALNPNGNKYCGLFPGDLPVQQFLGQLSLWYQSAEINKCNTLRRLSYGCMMSWWDAKNTTYYDYYNLNSKMYPFVQNMPDCVAQVYAPEYYYAKQQYQQYQN